MKKFSISTIETLDGKSKDIEVFYKNAFDIKSVSIGAALIACGVIVIIRGAFKKGSFEAMNEQLNTEIALGLIKD